MAFNQRLVVFDMDGTLVTGYRNQIVGCKHKCVTVEFIDGPVYVYVRPYMVDTLIQCRNDPRNVLILFSSGSFEYVHAIVANVINPSVREVDPDFYFDGIYTKDDMPDHMIKPIGELCQYYRLETSILIDDLYEFCAGSGAFCYHLISYFNPNKPEDTALCRMLDLNFFN